MEDIAMDTTLKKESVLERINKRNKDRLNCLDAKIELRNKENLELEGVEYFSHTFAERVKLIDQEIKLIEAGKALDLNRKFAEINSDIQEIQRYLTASTIFLTDYKIKACQCILNDLLQLADEVKQKLLPKKKFGFNSKKISTKIENLKTANVDKIDFGDKPKIPSSCFEWTLANRKSEHLILVGEEVDGKDVTISNITNCLVEIRGHPGSVQISVAENCTLISGPIARSFFAENCNNSTIVAACQQLRFHSSINCKLWLHVTSRAIIEDCNKIEIGDYNYDYSGIDIDFKKAGLDRTINNYKDVADFNWLSPDIPSPNWKLANGSMNTNDWTMARSEFHQNKKL